ncbi:hypothetical protein ACO2Q0_05215 [Phenylobacterium sp. VNQ135]|uniref:terminase small subunit-like protein n=1 Tax=Phenylobacterium sp. VNQ135 TaxID=3400922 RepID=UPI003C04A465
MRFTEALADEIVARVAMGESLGALEQDPRMPSRTAIGVWRRSHVEFGERLAAAQRRARLERRLADRAREAERKARRAALTRRDGGHEPTYTPEIGEEICFRLANGESLISICREEHLPTPATVYRWVNRIPEFQDMYVDARQFQGDYLFDETRELAREVTPGNVWACRFKFDLIRWQAPRLSPRKYCERLVAQDAAEMAQPMTVIVRKFTDHPDETPEEREALRRGKVVWSTAPGVKPGDLTGEG